MIKANVYKVRLIRLSSLANPGSSPMGNISLKRVWGKNSRYDSKARPRKRKCAKEEKQSVRDKTERQRRFEVIW